jgi:plastocyanin
MEQRGRLIVTAVIAGGMFLAGGLASAAQDATPAATGDDHPAHIHVGACDNLDPNPTYMLTDVKPIAGSSASSGPAAAIPVEESVTTVDAPLDTLATGGYAINIHHSAADIGTYIACGNLTGTVANGMLIVGLGELNDSGHSGIAVLTEKGNQTDVTVYLAQGLSGVAMGQMATASTPAASASSNASAAATSPEATQNVTEVDIKNLAYNPASVEIPVGGTVTWTNSDSVPHTVTGMDRSVLQSGTMDPGATFSKTFDKAGTYDYFCEFHANMKGTVVVK